MSKIINKNLIAIIMLLFLTVAVSIVSGFGRDVTWAMGLILGLSAIKFVLVGFQFMELNKAHIVWKLLFLGMLFAFIGGVLIALA